MRSDLLTLDSPLLDPPSFPGSAVMVLAAKWSEVGRAEAGVLHGSPNLFFRYSMTGAHYSSVWTASMASCSSPRSPSPPIPSHHRSVCSFSLSFMSPASRPVLPHLACSSLFLRHPLAVPALLFIRGFLSSDTAWTAPFTTTTLQALHVVVEVEIMNFTEVGRLENTYPRTLRIADH